MRKKRLQVALLAAFSLIAMPRWAEAITLEEAAREAVLRNPEVNSRWHAYREATEGIDVARGAFRPKVDLSADIARERLNEPGRSATSYTRRGLSAILTHNLFDGFASRSELERLSYAQRVRYFELLDASESIALETARAYNDVLRYRKLYALAEGNYVQHRVVFEQIQRRVKSGVGRRVDLEQASGRLALAEANLLTEASNLHDVGARYQRIVGSPPPADMTEPRLLDAGLPKQLKSALSMAYERHPALAAAQENIVSSMSEAKGRRAKFKPRVDLQARKDLGWDVDGVDGRTDVTSVGVVLNYNLYNGGADVAAERQYWERVNVAKDLRDKACRDIRQTLTIAHHDIGKLSEQLLYLDAHQLATEKARDAYRKQFDIGQRTLLDLLDTENELFEARRAYVNGVHDHALAHARTQAGMGNLLASLNLQHRDTPSLAEQKERAEFDANAVCPAGDAAVVAIDKEKIFADALAANPDLLPPDLPVRQPLEGGGAMNGGAGMGGAAGAMAGVGGLAVGRGAFADADGDGVADDKDACPNTAKGVRVDERGCEIKPVSQLKGIGFRFASAELTPESLPALDVAVEVLKRHPGINLEVAGHTDNIGGEDYNLDLSEKRANSVVAYFVSQGIDADRLVAIGYGKGLPIASNDTEEGRALNRRVEMRPRH